MPKKKVHKFRGSLPRFLVHFLPVPKSGKPRKIKAKVGWFDVSNGRAALSGSFINVRAPNFLQPKTSLSSCRPLFELFSKKQHWLFFSEMISPQVTLRQSYPLIFMFTGSKISSVFCMDDIFVLLKMKIVFLHFILQIKCNSRSIQNLFYIGFRCSFIKYLQEILVIKLFKWRAKQTAKPMLFAQRWLQMTQVMLFYRMDM